LKKKEKEVHRGIERGKSVWKRAIDFSIMREVGSGNGEKKQGQKGCSWGGAG